MRRLALLGLASMVSMVLACGGSGESPAGAPPGSGTLPDGGALPDGALADGGDAGACPPAPTMVLEARAGSLDVTGDEIVFIDHDAGVDFLGASSKTKAIRKVRLDGTGDAVLYTASASHQINDVKTVGATVFFLESERNEFGSEATTLFSMPVAGGAPTIIGTHADPEVAGEFNRLDAIVSADAGSVYVVRGGPAVGFGSLWRFAVSGGAESVVYRGNVKTKPQKVGEEFYFASSDIPSGVPFVTVVKVPATGGALTAVGAARCRGDLTAGAAFGVLCAGSEETTTERKLSRWDLEGRGHSVVFELPAKSSQVVEIGPSDGTSVYVARDMPAGSAAEISKAPLAGGPSTVVACDRQKIPQRKTVAGGINGAYVSELDMVATATELVWTETRKESGGPEKTAIYRTAR
jgi:hypothetical protein